MKRQNTVLIDDTLTLNLKLILKEIFTKMSVNASLIKSMSIKRKSNSPDNHSVSKYLNSEDGALNCQHKYVDLSLEIISLIAWIKEECRDRSDLFMSKDLYNSIYDIINKICHNIPSLETRSLKILAAADKNRWRNYYKSIPREHKQLFPDMYWRKDNPRCVINA